PWQVKGGALAESRDSVSGRFQGRRPWRVPRAEPLVGSKGKALGRRLWRRNTIFKLKSTLRKQSSELFANEKNNVFMRADNIRPYK
ncbi:MAG: hypothetical protein IKW87_05020, partial [Ruminococcus sp.]|nr:hypothetical protein [Ruminococcus sp.]